ncbi:MAG: hypothetical protein QGH60_11555 [Phycisphaerae bacterium]|jgi:hypothetical protein|nr:hypothetical protein [Phycisphaerae bacterium]
MAELTRQCNATVTNATGKLAEVTDKLKDAGVNILAMCAWGEGDVGHLMLVADDPQKACESISPAVDECGWDEVVRVHAANTPGSLNEIAHKLAEAGIDVAFTYASTTDAPEAVIILNTSDNARAAEIL